MTKKVKYTNKEHVLMADPTCLVDYYETLRGVGKPCYYVRSGLQGPPRSSICASPRAAWADAAKRLFASIKAV
jgi:hypothetical protein